QNIVSNAIDYTPDGGEINITFQKDNNRITIEIKDTGIGIPLEAQEHIFEKFYRGDNAKKTETDRSGLGLYISKQIIERHGGTITVESEVGKGTRMVVSIPS
ncbi:MAG: sensor histidine kinase, partial [Candidatus Pacebacteria bacterium]|nr:sensor histidine kinase [Candidatus Paceibacterota bacterium]